MRSQKEYFFAHVNHCRCSKNIAKFLRAKKLGLQFLDFTARSFGQ